LEVEAKMNWILIANKYPEPGNPTIVAVKDGKRKIILRAAWIPKHFEKHNGDDDWFEYDEESDTYYTPEGWYEWNDNEETHWNITGEIVAWMPLPEFPSDQLIYMLTEVKNDTH
jgi:hypothetical protein